jgi:hypothetical protein
MEHIFITYQHNNPLFDKHFLLQSNSPPYAYDGVLNVVPSQYSTHPPNSLPLITSENPTFPLILQLFCNAPLLT